MKNNLQDDNLIREHNNTLAKTYATLIIAFLCLAFINIFAFITMQKMSKVLAGYKTASLQIQLDISAAYQLLKDSKTNASKLKDYNQIWRRCSSAIDQLEYLSEIESSEKIKKSIYAFKNGVLLYVKAKNSKKDLVEKKWLECAKLYHKFRQTLSKTDGEVKLLTDEKFKTLDILFIISLFIIFVLFMFLLVAFKRYSKQRLGAETNLLYAKKGLDTVVNAIQSLLISCDKDKKITLWNNAAEKFTGISNDEAMGAELFELLPMLKNYSFLLDKVYHSKHTQMLYHEKIEFSNGQEAIYNIELYYTHGLDNVVIKLDDVTEQTLMDEQLRMSQKMSVVSNMVNGLVHSFNNVLGAILGTVTMMKFSIKKRHLDWDVLQENVDVIESSSEKAELMLEQILSLTVDKPPKRENVDLNEEIIHFMKICENTLDKSIQIDAELVDVKPYVLADKKQLELVFMALSDNAAYSMLHLPPERSSEEMFLTVSIDHCVPDESFRESQPLAVAESYWAIHIGDTGTGIPMDLLSKIFEPFFSTKSDCTGLGLAIVEDIISQHNGFIEVRSELGTGCIVSIYLPELKVANLKNAVLKKSNNESENTKLGVGTVLIVDDDETIRTTASNIIEQLGYKAITAEDGVHAVQLYRNSYSSIDLVLLDISMPRFSGKETYIELQKINPDLKVLLFSGLAQQKRIDEILSLGANDFIKKPFSFESLSNKIDSILKNVEC